MELIVYNSDTDIDTRNEEVDEPEERMKYLKEIEVIKLLTGIKNELHSLLFLFIFETGARCTEALRVKLKDIDPYNRTVKLETLKRHKHKGEKTKTRVYRVLAISDALLSRILLYDKKLGLKGTDDLFVRKAGDRHISIQAVNKAMKKYVTEILGEAMLGKDFESFGHPHVLRHSRAIQLINSGEVDLVKLMKFLGHSSIRSTLVYTQFTSKDVQDSVRRANTRIGL